MAKSGQEYIAWFTALRQALQASQGEPSCWSQKKHPLYISQKVTPRIYFPKIYQIKTLPSGLLTSFFAPFGRSGLVTHANNQYLYLLHWNIGFLFRILG